jgi:hypothetical protein
MSQPGLVAVAPTQASPERAGGESDSNAIHR